MSQNQIIPKRNDENLSQEEEDVVDESLDSSLELEPFLSPLRNSVKQIHKDHVFLWKGHFEGALITTLQLPKSDGTASRYVITPDKEILELQRIKINPSSWFIDQDVKEDGSLYVTTPIDPLFLVIPRLDKMRERGSFVSVDEVFIDSEYPGYRHLKDCKNLNFDLICDIETVRGERFVRLNEDKLIHWLKEKVNAICEYLVSTPETVSMSIPLVKSQVEGFKTSNIETLTEEQQLTIAVGLLSEYLPKEYLQKLKKCYPKLGEMKRMFDVPTTIVTSRSDRKRKLSSIDDFDLHNGDDEHVTSPKKKRRKSLSQAKLDKVDTKKIPKITSFFTPPNKK